MLPSLAELVTLDKLEAWAAAKPPRTVVGRRGKPHCCPIASYVQEQGFTTPYVGGGYVSGWENPHTQRHLTYSWGGEISGVLQGVDCSSPRSQIQARTFLKIVRQIKESLRGN